MIATWYRCHCKVTYSEYSAPTTKISYPRLLVNGGSVDELPPSPLALYSVLAAPHLYFVLAARHGGAHSLLRGSQRDEPPGGLVATGVHWRALRAPASFTRYLGILT
jgi:hypothetical protein